MSIMLPRYIQLSLLMYVWPIEGHAAASLQMRDSSFSLHNVGHALLFCARLVNFLRAFGQVQVVLGAFMAEPIFCFTILLLVLGLFMFGRPSYCGFTIIQQLVRIESD